MSKFEEYINNYSKIEGWFSDAQAALFDIFLEQQDKGGIRGNLFEVGVAYGKSAHMLHLHANGGETLYLNDINAGTLAGVAETMRKERSGVEVITLSQPSDTLSLDAFTKKSVRFMHLDADHRYQGVKTDMALADHVLCDDGIVVLDDFLSPPFIGVTAAFFEYVAEHPNQFHMFLGGLNKGYACRPHMVDQMLTFIRDSLPAELRKRKQENWTIWWENGDNLRGFGINYREWNRDFASGPLDMTRPESENPLKVELSPTPSAKGKDPVRRLALSSSGGLAFGMKERWRKIWNRRLPDQS